MLKTLVQVLGRQVALGEDEEAPEDPGAVGEFRFQNRDLMLSYFFFMLIYQESFKFCFQVNLSKCMAGTLDSP